MTQGHQITFKPSLIVAERLSMLGRTEDVIFSPDQTRLAIAGFKQNKILVIEIKIVHNNSVIIVHSDACVEILCPDLNRPHGLSWIDDDTLVIANRGKDVIIVSVPDVGQAGAAVEVTPLLRLSGGSNDLIRSPGSVDVIRLSDEYFDVLVCNNYRNYVSRHIIQRNNGFEAIASVRLFEHDLKVPDSIAASSDGELIAVSNHYGHRIDVFPNHSGSGTQTRPDFSLDVSHYPHGVRFGMNDRLVLVADAGAPVVHVFARDGADWKDCKTPSVSIKVMDDAAFRRGQINPQEGGPKGVDILADGSLFVVSCEELPIAFFDFRSVRNELVAPHPKNHRHLRSGDARMRDTVLATMKAQQRQIEALQAEFAMLKPAKAKRGQRLDRWIVGLLERAARKASGTGGKG